MRAGAQDYVLKENLARLAPAIDRELREVKSRRERRLIQEALQRSEQTLQSIIDSSNAAIWLKDVDGSFITINTQHARLLGIARAEAVGKTDYDFLPLQVADQHKLNDREVIEHAKPTTMKKQSSLGMACAPSSPRRSLCTTARGPSLGSAGSQQTSPNRNSLRKRCRPAATSWRKLWTVSGGSRCCFRKRCSPGCTPAVGPGYEVAAEYVPAYAGREIGGDFYDAFRVGESRVGLLIGDVAGKGLEAAAMAATTRSTIHAFVHESASPADALGRANSVLYSRQVEFESLATAFLVSIDLATGEISYANAGHPPAFICHSDGNAMLLELGQMPLAVVEKQVFEEHRIPFGPGDKLVLYTDGISEARQGRELLGLERVQQALAEHSHASAAELAHALLSTATDWASGQLTDDAAVLVLERSMCL